MRSSSGLPSLIKSSPSSRLKQVPYPNDFDLRLMVDSVTDHYKRYKGTEIALRRAS